MNQILVHPQVKKIIQNLDLDLGLELNRYEKNLKGESIFIPDSMEEKYPSPTNTESNSQNSYSSLVYNPNIELEEPIPVASRIIEDHQSILDILLTPWGIIGIILFFGANIFIFFSLQKESLVNNLESETSISNIENQNPENKITENSMSLPKIEKTEDNKTNINTLQQPPLPISLPEINNPNSINHSPPKSSLYPDLKSALFAEIQKNQQSLLPQPLSTKPLSPPSSNINQTPPPLLPSNNLPVENIIKETPINPPIAKVEQKYYLLSNYQNMNDFNRIKKIVPNALIMNLNKEMKIQLGIFNTEIDAKNQGEKLQNQGIKIFIYPVNN
ncbi:hypothetical protein [Geminocystis sp. GBBB08]|uniref:hypothetical protein n=1 Tax=Geminocystis sp. GBBB08 TaxID=2604140 RepID=UPI0027E351CE|nr:hypothetical protein [Geminocystis sp. GBBB08]MBL1211215.1 hypothetical protein [Geminocystis sp. GBBB08]